MSINPGIIGNKSSIAYELWGSIYNPTSNYDHLRLFATVGIFPAAYTELKSGDLVGVSASFSKDVIYLTWATGVIGIQYVKITANCAFTASITTNPTGQFFLNSILGYITLADGIVGGGDGSINSIGIERLSASGPGSGVLTIYYSNGAGGMTSTTVTLTGN
jgi:hypothetical protein